MTSSEGNTAPTNTEPKGTHHETPLHSLDVIALVAGAAPAAIGPQHERPEAYAAGVSAIQKVQVTAGSLLSGKDLQRAGLSAGNAVEVTQFPSTGTVDRRSRDN